MNAYSVKGDTAACERVMRDMRAAGQEPDVSTWNTLMHAHYNARSGEGVLRTYLEMQKSGCSCDSFTLSFLFKGLIRGIKKNPKVAGSATPDERRLGALKVVELAQSLITPSNLNHIVSVPVLRALADVATAADVDSFWSLCDEQLRSTPQGWPGRETADTLSKLCSRSGDRGAWARVSALLSSSGYYGPILPMLVNTTSLRQLGAVDAGFPIAWSRGGAAKGAATPRVICKNWQETGSCKFGDKCHFKDGHKSSKGDPQSRGGAAKGASTSGVICKNWHATGSCKFGDKCHYKDGHR
jgi:pentatricopeptide repeat protein